MWPKALSQLVELAPHVTRLLPLADRYFKDKTAGDDATRQALDAYQASLAAKLDGQQGAFAAKLDTQIAAVNEVNEGLRGEIRTLSAAQAAQAATTERQLAELAKYLGTARADALAAKQATEALDGRLTRIEAAQRRAQVLLVVSLALLLAVFVLIATLFLRAH